MNQSHILISKCGFFCFNWLSHSVYPDFTLEIFLTEKMDNHLGPGGFLNVREKVIFNYLSKPENHLQDVS